MSMDTLKAQLQQLRSQLQENHPMSEEERASLESLAQAIKLRLENNLNGNNHESLIEGIQLAAERFELAHPNTATTLRNIMQSLVSMGV